MRGLVIGGTRSGVGKTVATLAVIRSLRTAGYEVQPAKAGPDFIDPSHHAQVAARPSRTLDCWLQGKEGLRRNYHRGTGDVCVVEGVMGLYDGSGSSTAMVAEALDLPVVLVVDASAGMESVAATALGFREYANRAGHDIDVPGVIAQRAHGGRHEKGIIDALPEGFDYLGRVPPLDDLQIPDRHLGLHMGEEAGLESDALDAAADHLRPDPLLKVARTPPGPAPTRVKRGRHRERTTPRIAVARDPAFCFVYPATMERLESLGTVRTFSPVAHDRLPSCDAVYLPGGYPELHAERLEESPTLESIAEKASEGVPVLGECGGLMVLADSLTTRDGTTHSMAGVLPASVRMHDRYQALDHVRLRAGRDTLTSNQGQHLRGHEFHYSSADVQADAQLVFEVERGSGITDGRDGLVAYRTLGTYCHVHPESGAFDNLVESI